jgi:hypothetical protein
MVLKRQMEQNETYKVETIKMHNSAYIKLPINWDKMRHIKGILAIHTPIDISVLSITQSRIK